jgi:hypothetical protein
MTSLKSRRTLGEPGGKTTKRGILKFSGLKIDNIIYFGVVQSSPEINEKPGSKIGKI